MRRCARRDLELVAALGDRRLGHGPRLAVDGPGGRRRLDRL